MQAAASNPEMEPVVRLARGHLHRIGLDLHAAADINKLNEALTEAKLDTVKRIEIKQLLFQIGVID
jgi:hypothetical protein